MKFNFLPNDQTTQPTMPLQNGHVPMQNGITNGFMMVPHYTNPLPMSQADMGFGNGWTVPINGYAAISPSEPTISEVEAKPINGIKILNGRRMRTRQSLVAARRRRNPNPK
jgi:hypothetical protein